MKNKTNIVSYKLKLIKYKRFSFLWKIVQLKIYNDYYNKKFMKNFIHVHGYKNANYMGINWWLLLYYE